MQRVVASEVEVEMYVVMEGHRQMRCGQRCPQCGAVGRMHRHGSYERGVTCRSGRVVRIAVARFLCRACGRTVSCLPDFALPYRLVQTRTFEAFLESKVEDPGVQRWQTVLQAYRRRLTAFAPQLWRVVGCGLGRAPPEDGRVWPWLKEACGGLVPAARRLVAEFRLGLFRQYQCHRPAAG